MTVNFENTALPDVIELKNICQEYPDPKTKANHVVIKDLNLLIEDKPNQGQFVVILGKSGCGKCVNKGTWVRFSTGIRRIEDVVPYDNSTRIADRWNWGQPELFDTNKKVLVDNKEEKLSHLYYGGYKEGLVITTEEGYELGGSYNHPVCVSDVPKKWKKFKNLKIGDQVLLNFTPCIFSKSNKRSSLPKPTKKFVIIRRKIKKYKNMGLNNREISKLIDMSVMQIGRIVKDQVRKYTFNPPQFLSKSVAYYLGLLAGDGTVTKNCSFTNMDEELIKFFINYTRSNFKVDCSISTKKNNKVKLIRPYEMDRYSDWILKVFGHKSNADTKDVPGIIRKADYFYQLEFLRGLFDTDGSASKGRAEISLNSKYLIDFVCNMLSAMGIDYSIKKRKKSYRVFTKRSEKVHFLFRLKRKKKEAIYTKEKISKKKLCKIVKIEKKQEDLFDLTNPVSNSFVANGFIVHNSTVLRYIAGLQKPTSGEILIYGKPRTKDKIGMVFQKYSSFPWLKVIDNVEFGLTLSGMGEKEKREKALAMMETVGLTGQENKYPAELSGGQQQRVAIARSLLCNSSILLMDEPFGALDISTRLKMQDFLMDLWRKSLHDMTIIFVTHDIPEAVYLGQEIWIMSANPGKIVERIPIDLSSTSITGLSPSVEGLWQTYRNKEIKREKKFTDYVYQIEDHLNSL